MVQIRKEGGPESDKKSNYLGGLLFGTGEYLITLTLTLLFTEAQTCHQFGVEYF